MDSRTYGLALAALEAGVWVCRSYDGTEYFSARKVSDATTVTGDCYGTPMEALAAAAEALGLSPIYPTEGMVLPPVPAEVSSDHFRSFVKTKRADADWLDGKCAQIETKHPTIAARNRAEASMWRWIADMVEAAALSGTPQGEEYLQSPGWQRQLAEAEADVQAGRVHKADSAEDLLRELNDEEPPSREVKD